MPDIESLLNRWQKAGVLDSGTVARIRAFEEKQEKPSGLRWQGLTALILGGILLACGVVLFVSAHWDQLGPGARYLVVIAMVAVFHIAGGYTRKSFQGVSTALHAVGTVSTGAAIALVGQIFNIQEHWPAAILMWAIAALFGWILLHDQVQQTLTLLLFPAWMISEFSFSGDAHIGEIAYMGRFLFLWSIFYLTIFLGSRRKVTQGILFVVSALAAIVGTGMMLEGWTSWSAEQSFVHFGTRVWIWVAMAALPLCVAAFKGHKGLIPIAVALVYAISLPWCYRTWTETLDWGDGGKHVSTRTGPNLAAYLLVAAFAVFVCWWGVRQASRALVNLGIVGFAVTVAWFYWSSLFDKMSRSLALIGLGILFLAGGWALEKMRRRLLAGMGQKDVSVEEAK